MPLQPAGRGSAVRVLPYSLLYDWKYRQEAGSLLALYDKARELQWHGEKDLDWTISVDPERETSADAFLPLHGSDIHARMDEKERRRWRYHVQAWMVSQFLHGEQGALLATSQLVSAVEATDAKLFAATQVMDEARHVEVYARYIRDKVQLMYPCNENLRSLLDTLLTDSRWDFKYLGMQIMVEGLALAAFNLIQDIGDEPLLRNITHFVIRDEARHVAFGLFALRDHFKTLSPVEKREREEFVYEASVALRDRFLFVDVWERLGYPVEECKRLALESEGMQHFRRLLFSNIVPNVKRLGLLSDDFLRPRFAELGVLEFEDLPTVALFAPSE
ncbi:MAG: ferritin-like domain-containing protein [Myxococcota bacterium]